MVQAVSELDPAAVVILVVAVIGLLPIVAYYRTETRVFVFAYAFLLTAAIATNVENVILPDIFNLIEHAVGILGSGIMFAVAAYLRRRETVNADEGIGAEVAEG